MLLSVHIHSCHLANRRIGVLLGLNIFLISINISYFDFIPYKKKISLFLIPSFLNIMFLVIVVINFSLKMYYNTYIFIIINILIVFF